MKIKYSLCYLLLLFLGSCDQVQEPRKEESKSIIQEETKPQNNSMLNTINFNDFRMVLPQNWNVVPEDVVGKGNFALRKDSCDSKVCPNMVYTTHEYDGSMTGLQFLDYWLKNAATESYNLERLDLNILDSDTSKVRYEYLISSESFVLRGIVFFAIDKEKVNVFTFTGPNSPTDKMELFVKESNQIITSLETRM